MRGILTAKRAVIPKWELNDIGLNSGEISKDAALIKEVSLSNIVIEKETYIIKEGEPEEMVEELLSKLTEDMKGIQNNPNLQAMMKDLRVKPRDEK